MESSSMSVPHHEITREQHTPIPSMDVNNEIKIEEMDFETSFVPCTATVKQEVLSDEEDVKPPLTLFLCPVREDHNNAGLLETDPLGVAIKSEPVEVKTEVEVENCGDPVHHNNTVRNPGESASCSVRNEVQVCTVTESQKNNDMVAVTSSNKLLATNIMIEHPSNFPITSTNFRSAPTDLPFQIMASRPGVTSELVQQVGASNALNLPTQLILAPVPTVSSTPVQQVNTSGSEVGSLPLSPQIVSYSGNVSSTGLQQVNSSVSEIGGLSLSPQVVTYNGNVSSNGLQQVNTSVSEVGSLPLSPQIVSYSGNVSSTGLQQVNSSVSEIGGLSLSPQVVTYSRKRSSTGSQQVKVSRSEVGSLPLAPQVIKYSRKISSTGSHQVVDVSRVYSMVVQQVKPTGQHSEMQVLQQVTASQLPIGNMTSPQQIFTSPPALPSAVTQQVGLSAPEQQNYSSLEQVLTSVPSVSPDPPQQASPPVSTVQSSLVEQVLAPVTTFASTSTPQDPVTVSSTKYPAQLSGKIMIPRIAKQIQNPPQMKLPSAVLSSQPSPPHMMLSAPNCPQNVSAPLMVVMDLSQQLPGSQMAFSSPSQQMLQPSMSMVSQQLPRSQMGFSSHSQQVLHPSMSMVFPQSPQQLSVPVAPSVLQSSAYQGSQLTSLPQMSQLSQSVGVFSAPMNQVPVANSQLLSNSVPMQQLPPSLMALLSSTSQPLLHNAVPVMFLPSPIGQVSLPNPDQLHSSSQRVTAAASQFGNLSSPQQSTSVNMPPIITYPAKSKKTTSNVPAYASTSQNTSVNVPAINAPDPTLQNTSVNVPAINAPDPTLQNTSVNVPAINAPDPTLQNTSVNVPAINAPDPTLQNTFVNVPAINAPDPTLQNTSVNVPAINAPDPTLQNTFVNVPAINAPDPTLQNTSVNVPAINAPDPTLQNTSVNVPAINASDPTSQNTSVNVPAINASYPTSQNASINVLAINAPASTGQIECGCVRVRTSQNTPGNVPTSTPYASTSQQDWPDDSTESSEEEERPPVRTIEDIRREKDERLTMLYNQLREKRLEKEAERRAKHKARLIALKETKRLYHESTRTERNEKRRQKRKLLRAAELERRRRHDDFPVREIVAEGRSIQKTAIDNHNDEKLKRERRSKVEQKHVNAIFSAIKRNIEKHKDKFSDGNLPSHEHLTKKLVCTLFDRANNPGDLVNFLMECGVIRAENYCVRHPQSKMALLTEFKLGRLDVLWQCPLQTKEKQCPFSIPAFQGTIFNDYKMHPRDKLLLLIYVGQHYTYSKIVEELPQCSKNFADIQFMYRKVCRKFSDRYIRVGGRGTVVDINEFILEEPLCNLLEKPPARMVVSGIERDSGQTFAAVSPTIKARSACAIIARYVHPGSKVITSDNNIFGPLRQLDYRHKVVEKKSFVDPDFMDDAIKAMESYWTYMKRSINAVGKCNKKNSRLGLEGDLKGFLGEYLFQCHCVRENIDPGVQFLALLREEISK